MANIRTLKPNDKVDNYLILEEIGSGKGGFGKVYAAKQEEEKIALKIYTTPEKNNDYDIRLEKFKKENEILNKLMSHPNIVIPKSNHVLDRATYNGVQNDLIYYTMELMAGSLSGYLEKNSYNWKLDSRLLVFIQIAEALQFAHKNGIFHRDLYLDNILIDQLFEPITPKICDFGAAKTFDKKVKFIYHFPLGATRVTPPESSVGLLGSCTDKKMFELTDIYSLGLMFYNLTTLEEPFFLLSALDGICTTAASKGLHDPKANDSDRKFFLTNECIPYLNNPGTNKKIVIQAEINNKNEVESLINELYLEAIEPDYNKRLNSVSELITRVESCLRLML